MEIVAFSDTHNKHKKLDVPEGDVLIFAGDITMNGKVSKLTDFIKWFSKFPHKHKIVVAGNHDFCIENAENPGSIFKGTGIQYLEYDSICLDGVKFYGCPYSKSFEGYAFSELKDVSIPKDTDILITHGPPKGKLDYVQSIGHVGSKKLKKLVDSLDLSAHIFGHIHGCAKNFSEKFYNVSVTDEGYNVSGTPTVIKINE